MHSRQALDPRAPSADFGNSVLDHTLKNTHEEFMLDEAWNS